eukprot:749651_1
MNRMVTLLYGISILILAACSTDRYIYVDIRKTWDDANAYCKSNYGTSLATARNDAEMNELIQMYIDTWDHRGPGDVYVGFYNPSKDRNGPFIFVDGYDCNDRVRGCNDANIWRCCQTPWYGNGDAFCGAIQGGQDLKIEELFNNQGCKNLHPFICNIKEELFECTFEASPLVEGNSAVRFSWSSIHSSCIHQPTFGNEDGWCAASIDNTNLATYLQVDLGAVYEISAVSTRARGVYLANRHNYNQWVRNYNLKYSTTESAFETYGDLIGNSDSTNARYNALSRVIVARYVRFYPIRYNNHKSMRVEIYGKKSQVNTGGHNGPVKFDFDNDMNDGESVISLNGEKFMYLMYLIAVLITINIICLVINCYKKIGKKNAYKLVSVHSTDVE